MPFVVYLYRTLLVRNTIVWSTNSPVYRIATIQKSDAFFYPAKNHGSIVCGFLHHFLVEEHVNSISDVDKSSRASHRWQAFSNRRRQASDGVIEGPESINGVRDKKPSHRQDQQQQQRRRDTSHRPTFDTREATRHANLHGTRPCIR